MSNVFTGAITAGSPVAAPRDAVPSQDNTTFQALLERLQQFAAPTPKSTADAGTADPTADLQQALARADQSFTTAMDLRRQLEAAFHRQST